MSNKQADSSPSLSELPLDELVEYGRLLGLILKVDTPQGEALRLVRRRQELLIELDREAMLDIVRWLRIPVRQSADKEQLAQIISREQPVKFEGLSMRGLEALAKLNDVGIPEGASRVEIEKRMRRAGGVSAYMRHYRRRAIGSLVNAVVGNAAQGKDHDYRYLPDDGMSNAQSEIEQSGGLVGGVARTLRGVADDYVSEKLDEIEKRIDRKLDEIDHRLGEWRDREIKHRLRILKATLVFSILVAILSLLYDYMRTQ